MAIAQMKRIPGTLIVIGIGAQEPFEALIKAIGGLPKRLIVVEPAESRGAQVVQPLADLDGISLVDGILADATGNVELVEYNMPGLRGLAAPTTGLKALFPGLKRRATVPARKVGFAQVVPDPGDLPTPVRVRIDLPGAEPEILKVLDDGGVLARADQVSMRCGAEVMFEGGWDRVQLQRWLEARHYRLDQVSHEDADWPELRLKADPAGRRVVALERELAALKDAHDKLAAANEQHATALQEARSERDGVIAERDKAATERDEARAALDKTVAERDAAVTARDSIAPERDAAVAARDKAMADLGLAMRMQGLLQTDLDDLRTRFQQTEAVRKQQEELLRKLTPRLQEAAQQLRQLQLAENAGTDAERLTAKTSTTTRAKPRATTARKRTTRKKAADAK